MEPSVAIYECQKCMSEMPPLLLCARNVCPLRTNKFFVPRETNKIGHQTHSLTKRFTHRFHSHFANITIQGILPVLCSRIYILIVSYICQVYPLSISGISHVYHGLFLGMSHVYEIYMSGTSQTYLRQISGIFQAYLQQISGKSQPNCGQTQPILRPIIFISGNYQVNILGKAHAYLRHQSSKSQANAYLRFIQKKALTNLKIFKAFF